MGAKEDYAAAVERFKQANWYNGGTTATPTTGAQNLAAVINQPGNTVKNDPTKQAYITSVLSQAQKDSASQSGGGVATASPPMSSTPAAAPQNGNANAQSYIDQLIAAQKQAAMDSLGKARDASLSNLSAEEATIAPQYYDKRNQSAAGSQQAARNFQEYMAARGGASSGAAAQGQIANNSALQGNIGSLNRQEVAANTDIARRTTDVNNGYQSDVASANANLEADRMKSLLNDYYVSQQRGDTQAQQTIQNQIAQAQLQLQQQSQTFDQSYKTNQQNIQLDQIAYGKARDSILDKRYQAEFDQNVAQQGFENAIKKAVTDNQISTDKAQLLISQQNANTSSRNSNWAQDPNNPDNLYKMAELNKLKNGSSADMTKELDGLYTGLTSGQLTASAAISEIDGRVKAGLTTPAEAEKMKQLIGTVASSQPNVRPSLTQDQISANGGSNPQDLNSTQLENLWKTDPSGKSAGRPVIDWGEWYTDPRGRVGGISYEAWKQAYGPQLKAR